MTPGLFNQLSRHVDNTPPWIAIASASIAASFLMQEAGGIFLAGIAVLSY